MRQEYISQFLSSVKKNISKSKKKLKKKYPLCILKSIQLNSNYKKKIWLGVVAHSCNSRDSGLRLRQEDHFDPDVGGCSEL